MAEERVQRRLAAILAADIVGYSRLMEADEAGTLARIKALRSEVLEPRVAAYGGRIVKTTGDGILVEFPSAVDAVEHAVEVRGELARLNAGLSEDSRIKLRMGVNVGDIIIDGDDIFGDGVNIAARLETLSEPGEIYVSGSVYDQVSGKLSEGFDDLGTQPVKNMARAVHVYRVVPDLKHKTGGASFEHTPEKQQDIRFCTSSDGVRIAYATLGEGPPLVKAATHMTHLEYEWQSPVWRHWLRELSRDHRLIRYDERGNGLSDWEVGDISLEAFVRDLETVVDAAGLERFPLFGLSHGCNVSIAYAVRHPERVTRMVLFGGTATGLRRSGSPDQAATYEAILTLLRTAWGQENPAFRQMFTSRFIPQGTPEQMEWFNDLQRITVTGENAARILEVIADMDVSDLLSKVTVPTLVLHCRGDGIVPFERGRKMASMIPGARFVALDGLNHIILENDHCWPRFVDEVRSFLAET